MVLYDQACSTGKSLEPWLLHLRCLLEQRSWTPARPAKLSTETITLRGKMKADVAYNVICQRAGIDVIFDPSFEPRQMWLEFNGPTLREALEIVRLQSRAVWRAVAPHTIAVIPVPPQKIEYR